MSAELYVCQCTATLSDAPVQCPECGGFSAPYGEEHESDTPEAARTLREFNERFYVVGNYGGKCHICWEALDSEFSSHLILGTQSFTDFRNRFRNQSIHVGNNQNGNPIYQKLANFWLDHPQRRQYDHVEFAPDSNLGPKVRNLWQGFAFTPKRGDCSLYLAHLRDNICKGSSAKYEWLIGWMAYKVRHPGEQGYTAPVFRGAEGVGKNFGADPSPDSSGRIT